MVKLNFTPEQRVIISMLCDLYKKPEDRELDPNLILSAISGGHDWAFDWQYSGLLPEYVDSKDDVSFVTDVLDMWSFIELGWSKLSDDEKKEVHDAVPYLGEGPKFIGFDGNNEPSYKAIAEMIIANLGGFVSLKGRSLNSHSPKVGRYREMLQSWPDIRKTIEMGKMTVEQMIKLLSRD